MLVWIGAAAVALAHAACTDEVDGPAVAACTARAIIGGSPRADDPAVVALVVGAGESARLVCTGTLVSPHVVVAAGHCVSFSGRTPPSHVFFGSALAEGGILAKVRSFETPPGYEPRYQPDGRIAQDLAVLVLDEAAPAEVLPYSLAQRPPSVGQLARLVGYGCRRAGASCGPRGVKYEVSAVIDRVNATDFDYGVATCEGDSGGPAFIEEDGREVLAGVTSTGDEACAVEGTDTRVDLLRGWIEERVRREEPQPSIPLCRR